MLETCIVRARATRIEAPDQTFMYVVAITAIIWTCEMLNLPHVKISYYLFTHLCCHTIIKYYV